MVSIAAHLSAGHWVNGTDVACDGTRLRIGQLAMAVAVATVAAVLLSSSMNFSSETVLVQKHGASGISSLASALQQDGETPLESNFTCGLSAAE
eukprot:3276915-Rhodomonas_salina.2